MAYAAPLPPDAVLAWVEAPVEVQSHFINPRTKRDNLFLIYHLPKDVLFQTFSWVALSHSPSASEKDSDRYPVDQMKDLVRLIQACGALRREGQRCMLELTFGTRPSRSCFWSGRRISSSLCFSTHTRTSTRGPGIPLKPSEGTGTKPTCSWVPLSSQL